MTKLAELYINLDVCASPEEKEAVINYLSEVGHRYANEYFRHGSSISLEVEDGSLKIWLTVLGGLYLSIGQYGSFRAGLDFLAEDARSFGDTVKGSFFREANVPNHKITRVERRLGIPGKINRLLRKLEKMEEADTTNKFTRDEIIQIRGMIQNIVIKLDDPKDKKVFLENLPEFVRESPVPQPAESSLIPIIALKPKVIGGPLLESDGTLREFAKKLGKK